MNTWKKHTNALTMLILIACCGLPAWAQHHNDENAEGLEWELRVGGGAMSMPKYSGSDELEIEPTPGIDGSVELGPARFYLNPGDGAGVALEVLEFGSNELELYVGADMGDGRDRKDAAILKGTPNVENDYVALSGLSLEIEPIGELSVEMTYAPLTLNYEEKERKDIDYTGLLFGFDWGRDFWFGRQFKLNLETGLTFMNDGYAKANYSLVYPAERLTKTFKAGSGIHDVHLSTNITYSFTRHFEIELMGSGTYLLGDAADSPYTEQEFQPSFGAFVAYRFQ